MEDDDCGDASNPFDKMTEDDVEGDDYGDFAPKKLSEQDYGGDNIHVSDVEEESMLSLSSIDGPIRRKRSASSDFERLLFPSSDALSAPLTRDDAGLF